MSGEAVKLMKANVLLPRGQGVSKKKARAKIRGSASAVLVNGSKLSLTSQALQVYKGVNPSAVAWARGLETPFTGSPQKCPWNFNPVPSYLSFVATTVASRVGADTIGAGSTAQYTFMPGHGPIAQIGTVDVAAQNAGEVADMDEVAYHYNFQKIGSGGSINNFGPVNFIDTFGVTRTAAAFILSAGLATGGAINTSDVAGTGPVGWNATIPFTGDLRQLGHTRCKLLSMGVRFKNTTPEQFRGGSFVSVQPVTVCDITSPQSTMTIHPSWKDHGPDGCEVTWIPRLRDLAYWHPSEEVVLTSGVPTAPSTTNQMSGPGLIVWANNPSATAQTLDLEVVAHWEISGFAVQTISTNAKSTHVSDSVLKGALSAQINNAPTSSGFVDTLHAAAGSLRRGLEIGAKVTPRFAPAAAAATALL